MLRRWLPPLALALILAAIAYQVTLVQTPRLLMSAATRRVASAGEGYNKMAFAPLADAGARTIVRPSPDLAYASCPFDLSKGPVLVEVQPVPAGYWSLSVFDQRTDVAFVRNNTQASGGPIKVALIGKSGGQAPPGYEPVQVAGDGGIALVRILVDDRSRFAAIDKARRASSCRAVTPS